VRAKSTNIQLARLDEIFVGDERCEEGPVAQGRDGGGAEVVLRGKCAVGMVVGMGMILMRGGVDVASSGVWLVAMVCVWRVWVVGRASGVWTEGRVCPEILDMLERMLRWLK
jgi:hypothetical protein